jgi:hypothetical protein
MPNYSEYKSGEKTITVSPSGFKHGFSSESFFNGDDINFNVNLTLPYKKNINDFINLEWKFINKTTDQIIKTGILEFRYTNIKEELRKLSSDLSTHSDGPRTIWFTLNRAIKIGRRWDFDTYNLNLKEVNTNHEEVIAQLTLKDIDEYQLQKAINRNSMLLGILGGVLSGIIVFIILKAMGG